MTGPTGSSPRRSGETYALSRNPSWSPGSDPLRRAYVDHVSVRGGMTAAKVTELVQSGGADLSLDVPATSQLASSAAADALITTPSQASVVLAVGSRGPAALRLGVQGVRRVLAACIDAATRSRIATALGAGLATPADDLLTTLSLTPDGKRTPAASPSPSPTAVARPDSRSEQPANPGAALAVPSPSRRRRIGAPALPPARCAHTLGVTGAVLTTLIPDTAPSQAAAAIIASRLAIAGVRLRIVAPSANRYAALCRLGGWDLLLAVRPLRYPAPRSLLAPLLDAAWPGADAVSLRRAPVLLTQLLAATAERQNDAAIAAWTALDARLDRGSDRHTAGAIEHRLPPRPERRAGADLTGVQPMPTRRMWRLDPPVRGIPHEPLLRRRSIA